MEIRDSGTCAAKFKGQVPVPLSRAATKTAAYRPAKMGTGTARPRSNGPIRTLPGTSVPAPHTTSRTCFAQPLILALSARRSALAAAE